MKPLLKWVGGKQKILDLLLNEFPSSIENYRELFVGGGSVLIAVLESKRVSGNVYAYDLNKDLIAFYQHVQNNHLELYKHIKDISDEYEECLFDGEIHRKPTIEQSKTSRESYYYWIRSQYRSMDYGVLKSAMFLFLNKTCFRGVYRIGPNGFNVPFGNYRNVSIVDFQHLTDMHQLFQQVIFKCCDFTEAFGEVEKGDCVYLDPPYVPMNKRSFVGYNKDGFNEVQHETLFALCKKYKNPEGVHASKTLKKTFMIMSNSDTDIVRNHFMDWSVLPIMCKRSIHSKDPGQMSGELIIKSFL